MSVQAIDRIQPLWTDLQTEGMRLDAGAEVGGTRRTQPTLFSDIFQSAIEDTWARWQVGGRRPGKR